PRHRHPRPHERHRNRHTSTVGARRRRHPYRGLRAHDHAVVSAARLITRALACPRKRLAAAPPSVLGRGPAITERGHPGLPRLAAPFRSVVGPVRDAMRPGFHPTSFGASEKPKSGSREFLSRLTPRELEVLIEVGRGLSNGEIAAEMYLSEPTVKTHVSRILTS